jgi:hypothetical protein
VLDQRGQLLMKALGFAGCSLPSYDRALWALRTWLDSWSGIGHVTVGMAPQGDDLRLTRYDESAMPVVKVGSPSRSTSPITRQGSNKKGNAFSLLVEEPPRVV